MTLNELENLNKEVITQLNKTSTEVMWYKFNHAGELPTDLLERQQVLLNQHQALKREYEIVKDKKTVTELVIEGYTVFAINKPLDPKIEVAFTTPLQNKTLIGTVTKKPDETYTAIMSYYWVSCEGFNTDIEAIEWLVKTCHENDIFGRLDNWMKD